MDANDRAGSRDDAVAVGLSGPFVDRRRFIDVWQRQDGRRQLVYMVTPVADRPLNDN